MIDIRNVRYFLVLAEELHFGRAAERLHISQPPLSFAIQQLESHLGTRLFERTTRSVTLTPSGAEFLVEARRLMVQLKRCENFRTSGDDGVRARLQFGFTSSMLAFGLKELVDAFEVQQPQVRVELVETPVDVQLREIHDHRLHAGFCPSLTPIDRYAHRLIAEESYACCLPAQHALAGERRLALAQLREERFIAFARDPQHQGTDQTIRLCAEAGFHPLVRYYVRSWLSAITLVGRGFGICLVPRGMAALAMPGVRMVDIEANATVKTYFIWRDDWPVPALRSFVQFLDAGHALDTPLSA
ncbi:LysR substrate-binding domain-containing protein [Pseudorhodoferax sp.]|uniref:LysR substrate-binding domain-containing protein n=1 Tax=Pseudorhodoferax sp. TaxID=1993553 RepID=UPI002DD63E61|nr:LysR substrate-binding domain-containing protein [Pseudorhodoferax sp.]